MIRFGPSGIPLSCKGRTLRDAIEDVHTLGLTAMEIQMVRVNCVERRVMDEEVGLCASSLPGELVVEVVRRDGKKAPVCHDLDKPLGKNDSVRVLAGGIARDCNELQELGRIAKELDIQLSLHTPYYMDLGGAPDIAGRSVASIKWALLIAARLQATIVVTHLGLYGGLAPKAMMQRVVSSVREIGAWARAGKVEVKLGIEPSGRQEVFGSFDEILAVCSKVKGVIPVLNFAHIHARGGGSLKRRDDFEEVFDRARKYSGNDFYCHFSGVEHDHMNEKRYTPIKKGDLKFEPLAEYLLDHNFNTTVISDSPLLEHDAMYMKVILERVMTKKEARIAKNVKERE